MQHMPARLSERLIMAAAAALLGILLSVSGGLAQSQIANPERLDQLFAELALSNSEMQARSISDDIWAIWLDPADPELGARMSEVMQARRGGAFDTAIEILDEIVEQWPEYSEGWNQRATLYYLTGELQASLADIDKVLEFEPRHYGALAGQALIYRQLGDEAGALQSVISALRYHPYLTERRMFPQLHQPATSI
jgi:tetratricopeptide (TPR) repeat protein